MIERIVRAVPPVDAAVSFHFVRREGRIVASANVVPRLVATVPGDFVVAGLCGVMSHPEVRGMGLGKAVVLSAFGRVDEGEFPCALFQTGAARAFYEKLGCRVVANPIINSFNTLDPGASPLWDAWPMRYPGHSAWPDGTIDLLGPAW